MTREAHVNQYRRIAKLGCVCLMFAIANLSHAQSANEILQKMRDTYAAMKSYADTGVVLNDYGITDRHTFTTYFNRAPRHFILDFRKQGGDRFVIWADPDAFHTWWKTTGQQYDMPNPNNAGAISGSGQNTYGAALKIPTLLYSRAQLGGDFTNYTDAAMDGTENIDGLRCYRLLGKASDFYGATEKEVNIRKMIVWIDAQSFLIRQVRVESQGAGRTNKVTTTYQPQMNPTIDDIRFKFTPPQPK